MLILALLSKLYYGTDSVSLQSAGTRSLLPIACIPLALVNLSGAVMSFSETDTPVEKRAQSLCVLQTSRLDQSRSLLHSRLLSFKPTPIHPGSLFSLILAAVQFTHFIVHASRAPKSALYRAHHSSLACSYMWISSH